MDAVCKPIANHIDDLLRTRLYVCRAGLILRDVAQKTRIGRASEFERCGYRVRVVECRFTVRSWCPPCSSIRTHQLMPATNNVATAASDPIAFIVLGNSLCSPEPTRAVQLQLHWKRRTILFSLRFAYLGVACCSAVALIHLHNACLDVGTLLILVADPYGGRARGLRPSLL